MLAASDLPDISYGCMVRLDKEGIIVAANGLVKGSHLLGSQLPHVRVTNFANDVSSNSSQKRIEQLTWALVVLVHVSVLDRWWGRGRRVR